MAFLLFYLCVLTVGGSLGVAVFKTVVELKMFHEGFGLEDICDVSKSYAESNGFFRGLQFTKAFLRCCSRHSLLPFIDEDSKGAKSGAGKFHAYCRRTYYGANCNYDALYYQELRTISQLYPQPPYLMRM